MRGELIPPLLGYYTMAGGAVPWTEGPLVVGDSFTAADGTDLNGRTPDVINTPGNTWSATANTLAVASNKITPVVSATDVTVQATYDLEASNYLAKLTFYYGQTSGNAMLCQIIFRYQDATHFLSLSFGKYLGASLWKIMSHNGGTITDLTVGTYTFSNNTPYVISLQASWNDIVATVNGGTTLTTSSELFATATGIGVMIYERTTITNKAAIDDFQVYTL